MTVTLIQALATLAGALGLGAAVPALIRGGIAHVTGRAERERTAAQDAIDDAAHAHRRAARYQREALAFKEYSSRLRRLLIEHGVPLEQIPPWPECPKEDT